MPKKVNIKSQHDLSSRLYELHMQRKHGKLKLPRKSPLTKNQRQIVLDKTGSKCHVCGDVLTIDKFQADHVKPHCSGGSSDAENYLPSCATCNNYRWHYLSEELQWILKLGVFAKTHIEKETTLGKDIGEAFIKYEIKRELLKSIKSNQHIR